MKKLGNVLLNSLIVVTCIACLYQVGTQIYTKIKQDMQQKVYVQEGSKVNIPGVIAGKSELVVIVAQGCHFCEESAPFHRTIASSAIVLMAPKVDKDYLPKVGLELSNRVYGVPSDLKIRGTPALLLVKDGVVVRLWMGLLKPEQQLDVNKVTGDLVYLRM